MLRCPRVDSATPCLLLGGSALVLGGALASASPRPARESCRQRSQAGPPLLRPRHWPWSWVVGPQPGLCPGAPSSLASCGVLLAGRSLLWGLGTLSCGQGCVAGAFSGTPASPGAQGAGSGQSRDRQLPSGCFRGLTSRVQPGATVSRGLEAEEAGHPGGRSRKLLRRRPPGEWASLPGVWLAVFRWPGAPPGHPGSAASAGSPAWPCCSFRPPAGLPAALLLPPWLPSAWPRDVGTLVERSAVSWLCRVGGNSGREPRVQPGAGQVEGAVGAPGVRAPRPLRPRALPGGPGSRWRTRSGCPLAGLALWSLRWVASISQSPSKSTGRGRPQARWGAGWGSSLHLRPGLLTTPQLPGRWWQPLGLFLPLR